MKLIPKFNKSEDYCTLVSDKLFGVSVKPACYHHDRQYRNEVKHRKTRKEADIAFRDHTYSLFKIKNKPIIGWLVSRWRYLAVRLFAKWAWTIITK